MLEELNSHKPIDRKVYDPVAGKLLYNVVFCSPTCQYLTPKEDENHSIKDKHMCLKYKTRVLHLGYKPNIVKLEECDES
jgi:hypothetical protein